MIFRLKFRPQAKINKELSDKVPAKADDFQTEIPAAGENKQGSLRIKSPPRRMVFGLKFRPQAKINKEAFG